MRTRLFALVGAVLVCGALGGGAWVLLHNTTTFWGTPSTQLPPNPPPQKLPIVTSVPNAPPRTPARTPPPGYSEYRSEFYRFQLFYPSNMTVTERPGEHAAMTLLFAGGGHDFQLFILPYGEPKISQDIYTFYNPSGVMQNVQTLTLDGAPAAGFTGADQQLGDTYNVWFVGQGFLYQFMTYSSLSDWLNTLLVSWQFVA